MRGRLAIADGLDGRRYPHDDDRADRVPIGIMLPMDSARFDNKYLGMANDYVRPAYYAYRSCFKTADGKDILGSLM